jgi:hypothetical protein
MTIPARERMALRRYLQSMKCKRCRGVGCRECGGSGDSPRMKRLMDAASFGIKRAPL